MKVGDKVLIKDSKGAEGIIKGFGIRGCQLHGDEINYAIVEVTKPGHRTKLGPNHHYDIDQLQEQKNDNSMRNL